MHAEILSVGDEITSGQLLDTNAQWLSLRCEELGIRVLHHASVGDEMEALAGVLRLAMNRSDVIVATGGLGPTADDLTRQALAEATGRPLELDPQALEHIRGLFARRKRPMPRQNEVQALFPRGSQVIPNPDGTAPGIAIEVAREGRDACRLFFLPGVPAEMRQMWPWVAAELGRLGAGRRVICHRKINCFGAGESHIESMLPDLIRRGRQPRVGINASQTTIILRITAEGASLDECQQAMEPTARIIRQSLGNLVFGEGDEHLQHAVVHLLGQRGKTLSTCEWGTGGLVADWLGEVPQSASHCLGGIVVSNPQALQHLLDVSIDPDQQDVDCLAVISMAAACRKRFGSDLALAVGPFPTPDPAPSGKGGQVRFSDRVSPFGEGSWRKGEPVPLSPEPKPFHLALAKGADVAAKSIPFAAHPDLLKVYCAKQALNLVRLALLES